MAKKGVAFIFLLVLSSSVLAADWVEGEAIVQIAPGMAGKLGSIGSIDSLNRVFGVYEMKKITRGEPSRLDMEYGLDRVYLFRFSRQMQLPDFIRAYGQNRWIERVEPNHLCRLCLEPNDSLFSSQWNLRKIQCAPGWDIQTGADSVLIAVVDAGIEWEHPDLEDNLWINPEEDLNSNGRFDAWPDTLGGDIDSVDNDGNGYVDDVIGWDWTDDDNDPTPVLVGEDHGTWCNGIANAVTDNVHGIAGVAYNCRHMSLRCTYDATHIDVSAAIQAINYARQNEAHVISMSWGGYYVNTTLDNALQAAHAAGLILCGAAGNEDRETIHYPSGYDNVIAVAATNQTDYLDRSWSHSNYGDWVDLCAPGYGIYGTDPGHGYSEGGGTSGACPQVAALAALLKSRYPDSSTAFVENRIFNSCDSIPDSLFAQGKLGHGRINVYKAFILGDYCWLKLSHVEIDDSTKGNGNGRAEPQETVFVVVTVENRFPWAGASSVQARLGAGSPEVVVLDSLADFGNIPSNSSADNSAHPFSFTVGSVQPSLFTFYLDWEATPESYEPRDSFELFFRFPKILVVDDDDGASYETEYEATLHDLGYLFESWSIQQDGRLGEKALDHSILVWFTGDDSLTTLTAEEQEDISAFLDSGGHLFLTGQNIGEDIGGTPFYSDYLHAECVNPSTDEVFIDGVVGDEIGDGLQIATALNQTSRDVIRPLAGADSILMYEPDSCAAIKYESGYKLVYFAFGFEGIHEHPSLASKSEVMSRVLHWFDPTIVVEEDKPILPGCTKFFVHCFPNPFISNTTIVYHLPEASSLRIYDVAGRQVRAISPEQDGSGFIVWHGRDEYGRRLAPGVYFLRASLGESDLSRKMLILK